MRGGVSLVVDRYAFSGAAYTSAKSGGGSEGGGFSLQWCKNPDRGLLRPDLVLFMHLPPEQAQSRGDYGAERYEQLHFQQRVLDNFMQLRDDTWAVIEATSPIQVIHEQIVQKYEHLLECGSLDQQTQYLWPDNTDDSS